MEAQPRDPLAGSSWSAPGTVAGFARSAPNQVLMRYAQAHSQRASGVRLLDLGCGAGRNTVPLAQAGWEVLGTDLSWPMLRAAVKRVDEEGLGERAGFALAPMDDIPAADRSFDLVVAHGIWNLARSAAEFRRAVGEAARVARDGARLFVFTFSRHTLPPETRPVPGEPFVFTEFSGEPQCFLTAEQLVSELGLAGFVPDPDVPLTEYNRPASGLRLGGPPVIYEAAFTRIRA
jgi:SAM-dependent methyltransferase